MSSVPGKSWTIFEDVLACRGAKNQISLLPKRYATPWQTSSNEKRETLGWLVEGYTEDDKCVGKYKEIQMSVYIYIYNLLTTHLHLGFISQEKRSRDLKFMECPILLYIAQLLSTKDLAWNVEIFKWEVGSVELLLRDIIHFDTQVQHGFRSLVDEFKCI